MSNLNLKNKMYEVMKSIELIEKRGWNDFHGYSYATERDIKAAVRNELIKHKIDFTFDVVQERRDLIHTAKGNESYVTTIYAEYIFKDVDSDEEIKGRFVGTGEDKGDKGLYKAITGGIKYLLTSKFLIPTGDDPENESGKPQNVPQSTNVSQGGSGYQNAKQGSGAAEYKDCPNKAKCGGRIKGNFDLCYTCNQAKKNGNPVVMNNTGNNNQSDEIRMEDIPF